MHCNCTVSALTGDRDEMNNNGFPRSSGNILKLVSISLGNFQSRPPTIHQPAAGASHREGAKHE